MKVKVRGLEDPEIIYSEAHKHKTAALVDVNVLLKKVRIERNKDITNNIIIISSIALVASIIFIIILI